ncbi:hypothetical protein KC19_VG297000 [Ceratodon purpureus]|uniref:Phosphatidylinositol-specific phospholipase C X domain-containing protein n=1 Tax=Ceratodon purpureus TaxID=3225 RepID=A0A8T0HUW8_CERPU|nr:hypothetical protein KC19_VG297000 [Ceratodon purpureus]
MGAQISRQIQVVLEEQELQSLEESRGTSFPGSNIKHPNHKEWMATLYSDEITARDVVWPGTHNSATDRIGIPFFTRPFFQCQKYSIYEQLEKGVRVFDIRVQQDGKVCHGVLCTYSVDVVVNDVKKFLDETSLEFIILELRTEWKRSDPLRFDEYLISQLGEYLIPQDEQLLDKPLRELLPGRVFCVWKPSIANPPAPGSPLWTGDHLLDNWIDTDLPLTKFISNLEYLNKQAPNATRPYFYRVENTATPQNTGIWCVYPVTNRIRGYARLFLAETFRLGLGDRIQIFSEDFVTKDFVDACIGVTMARFAHFKQEKQDLLQPYQCLR